MKRSSGVRLCATTAVGALSLALVTGCGGDGSKDSAGTPAEGAGRPAAKALSAAELRKRVITDGEVPGYKVGAVPAGRAQLIKADDAKCEPVARVMSGFAPVPGAARTDRMATQEPRKTGGARPTPQGDRGEGGFEASVNKAMTRDITTVDLSSYEGDGAAKALKAFADAVKDCAGGFVGKQAGTAMKFTRLTGGGAAGAGDESVAVTAVTDMDGGKTAPVYAVVVRHGNTLASYQTVNFGAMMSGKSYAVSPEVVEAQSAKLK
ncbi:hypothetical protein AB0F36_30715 [Streptomyces sp. NPDC029080]|uniref:hypothetical protein n=1 Tax=Streptomyces sp. NPDC029080 TaxID=3155017 RepID=UPI003407935A